MNWQFWTAQNISVFFPMFISVLEFTLIQMVLQDHSSRPKVEKGPYFLQFGNQNLQVVHLQNLGFLSQIL